jgi:hypothetical protein
MPDFVSTIRSLTRRKFLATSAALSAASIFSSEPDFTASTEEPWYATIRRCGQINLNERDALSLDVDAWMDYWASLRVNQFS